LTRRREAACVAAALALYLAIAISAAWTHSATFDETAYLPAGYAALAAGDYRINTVHPPLSKMLGAVPLLFMDVRLDRNDGAWITGHPWKLGHRFLYQWNDADRLLASGRAAMTLLAVLLACGIYGWTRLHWGGGAAACALFLCLLSPDVLAHGALVTTDLAVACFFFLAVATFERVLERATPLRVGTAGAALGAALLSKHSALLLVAILPALAVLTSIRRDGARPTVGRVGRALGAALLTAGVAYGVLWAGYQFRFAAAADPAHTDTITWRNTAEPGLIQWTARFAADHRLLPEAYAHGLADLASRSEGRRAFLLGSTSIRGWWYYFPVAFALKTPLPLIVLLVLALRQSRGRVDWFLWGPVLAFGAATLATRVDIGYRYLLPLLPFLFVAAGRAAAALLIGGARARALLGVLAVWYAVGTLHAHPHYLAYFNEIAGGPYGGYRYLVDSNVDWGQDLKRLGAYVKDEPIPRIKLCYFGTASPEYYGIPHDLLPSVMRPFASEFVVHVRPGDIVVVSATNLQGVYLPRQVRPLMERLREMVPAARIGPSLFVYRSDFHWLLKPHLAEELGWLPQAISSYRQCRDEDPEHRAQAEEYLSDALRRQVRPAEDDEDRIDPEPRAE
jgi:hypothetical protein